jgi:hypothetical protein
MYKIQWSHHTEEEATWGAEHFLDTKYPDFLPVKLVSELSPLISCNFESWGEIPVKGGRL